MASMLQSIPLAGLAYFLSCMYLLKYIVLNYILLATGLAVWMNGKHYKCTKKYSLNYWILKVGTSCIINVKKTVLSQIMWMKCVMLIRVTPNPKNIIHNLYMISNIPNHWRVAITVSLGVELYSGKEKRHIPSHR